MRNNIILLALTTLTLLGCQSSKNSTQSTDSVAEQHACIPAAFDSTAIWTLTTLNGEPVPTDTPCTLSLNSEQGEIQGHCFINTFFGSFKATPCGKMRLDNMGMTMMAGPDDLMRLETAFLQALNSVNRYRVEEQTLMFLNGDTIILTFKQ